MQIQEFIEAQASVLPTVRVVANAEEGAEETALDLDLDATLARAKRHQDERKKARPHPKAAYEVELERFWDALGLENFSGREAIAVHKRVSRSGVANEVPPAWVALRLAFGLIWVQKDRAVLGLPIWLNSLYRTRRYNRAVGGGSLSAHLVGSAIDRALVGGPQRDLWQIDGVMRGRRLTLTEEQQRAIARWIAMYRLTPPFSQSVIGEPFDPRPLNIDLDGRDQAFTIEGGRGRYATFVHGDLRGIRTDWTG